MAKSKGSKQTKLIVSGDDLRGMIQNHDRRTELSRLSRLKYLRRHFGLPKDRFLTGGTASYFALVELELCFMHGAFLGTILCCQAFAENFLGGQLIMMSEDEAAESGFSTIVKSSLEYGIINKPMSKKLNELNRMRIAYGHVHVGFQSRGHMKRIVDNGFDPIKLLVNDSKKAIKTIAELLN